MLRSPLLVIGHVLTVDVTGLGERKTKTLALIAGAPFPFPPFLPRPSPFYAFHAGYWHFTLQGQLKAGED